MRPIAGRTTVNGSPVVANANGSTVDFAQCSPLVGLKVGVSKTFQSNWEVAGAAGVAISLVHDDHKVREHEFLIDVEVDKHARGGSFVGTGLSLWDFTHSDTITPAWMLHAGVPLGTHPVHPVYLMVESRLFMRQMDDVRNNYQVWGGLRVHF